jgi:hypothetical protein
MQLPPCQFASLFALFGRRNLCGRSNVPGDAAEKLMPSIDRMGFTITGFASDPSPSAHGAACVYAASHCGHGFC